MYFHFWGVYGGWLPVGCEVSFYWVSCCRIALLNQSRALDSFPVERNWSAISS